MNYFKHPQAIVESVNIGKDTRIWAFAHILSGAFIGENCNICDHTFIENDVVIGNRVTLKCGVQLWDGLVVEDDVFIGPNATFVNDPFPRSKKHPDHFTKTLIRKGASVGANATIMCGIVIGMNAMVGAGAVVTRDVPSNAIVKGNPARITGYDFPGRSLTTKIKDLSVSTGASLTVNVPGVHVQPLPIVEDMRGMLSFGEYEQHLPFIPKRYFIVYNVPSKEIRGEHAHRKLHQFLICVRGSCSVVIDDGQSRDEVRLETPGIGLYIPPLIWAVQYKYSSDAILLVFASDLYDAGDYIREYDEFLNIVSPQ
jgi:acetyltransferase-like isoleucine patch superfamily enzyme/dTDP-4-dehydrorhamnose 3,5-epimerase-like enzyme